MASPVVEADAKLSDRDDVLKIIGIDVFRAGAVQPGLIAESGDRLDHLRSDTLFLSPAAAQSLGVDRGGTLAFQAGLRVVTLRVAGLVPADVQQRFAVMDIAGVQSNFDRLGLISRIDLRLRPGVDIETVRARIQAQLPAGVAVQRPETGIAASESLSRSYRVNLNVLALVALFTGGLLVFSTQALAVVRRRSQLALLRVLGMTRRELASLLVLEGAIVGVVGSALGLASGFILAQIAVRIIGADLGAGYFRGVAPALPLAPISLAIFFGLGVLIAMLASLVPALEAARAAPAAALKAGDEERAFGRLSPSWPGFATIGAGAIAALASAGRGPAAVRLHRDRADADRNADADAADRGDAARSLASAERRAAAARIAAAARGPRTGRGEPRRDRRRREPDGLDGDHGRVVPDFARRVARARAAGRSLRARWRRRRYRLPRRRRSGAPRRPAWRAPCRIPARAAAAARPFPAAHCSACAQHRCGESVAPAPAGKRAGHRGFRCAAAGVGQRGDGRSVWFCTRQGRRASDRGQACPPLPSRECGATMRGRRGQWSSSASVMSR